MMHSRYTPLYLMGAGGVVGILGMFAVLATGPGGMSADNLSIGRLLAAWMVYAVGFFGPVIIWTRRN